MSELDPRVVLMSVMFNLIIFNAIQTCGSQILSCMRNTEFRILCIVNTAGVLLMLKNVMC